MNELIVRNEKVNFMGKEIPIIEGGFGENCRVMTAHMISDIHDVEVKEINRLTLDNLNEFEEGIDILNLLKVGTNHLEINKMFGINLPPVTKNFFIYSEQGYMALISLMRSEKAKEIRKYIRRDYFTMRKQVQTYKIPQTYAEALLEAGRLALENDILKVEVEKKTNEVIYKENIIIGLVDNVDLATKRQRLNQIIRTGDRTKISDRYNLLYREFEKKYSINLAVRLERNTNKKIKNKLDYIDIELNKIPELYELACKIFENSVEKLKSEWFDTIESHNK